MRPRSVTTQGWTAEDVPVQRGRTAVVTGANTGLGFETARLLAERGATVVLACRDLAKAQAAASRLHTVVRDADIQVEHLDLASLASVHAAAARIRARHAHLDLLINNAGLLMPAHSRTEDGFEATFGTNYLGPFALTGLLLDRLAETPGSRVVSVSSIVHRHGVLDFTDLTDRRSHRRSAGLAAYSRSKLANLMFTYELQRRLAEAMVPTIAVAAHPGIANSELTRNLGRVARAFTGPCPRIVVSRLIHAAPVGALATVRAAVDPEVRGGEFYGPPGRLQCAGFPERVRSAARSHDVPAQRRLWEESERLTGVAYQVGDLIISRAA
jgi:NAD(P)-dependent dehydrogenase (short-subunit alcohol dehydrogenase family)